MSNRIVPYARLAPLEPRSLPGEQPSPLERLVERAGENDRFEMPTDGLHDGELAWTSSLPTKEDGVRRSLTSSLTAANRPLRQHRLASTGWVEAAIKADTRNVKIDLHKLEIGDHLKGGLDQLVTGSVLTAPDPVYAAACATLGDANAVNEVGEQRMSGIFVAETGPFLKGLQSNTKLVDMSFAHVDPHEDKGMYLDRFTCDDGKYHRNEKGVPRNLGDVACLATLEAEIRERVIWWTPDGIVLSKDSGDLMEGTAYDTRMSQLVNVAVQGPATTRSFTSDLGLGSLPCQPGDHVFVCLVADLIWEANSANDGDRTNIDNAHNALKYVTGARMAFEKAGPTQKNAKFDDYTQELVDAKVEGAKLKAFGVATNLAKWTALRDAEAELDAAARQPGSAEARKKAVEAGQTKVDAARKAYDAIFENNVDASQTLFAQRKLRAGVSVVRMAHLVNFRWRRSTSAEMLSKSSYDALEKERGRLGLKFGIRQGNNFKFNGAAEYIVGAWRVGVVADAAAARASTGQTVRSLVSQTRTTMVPSKASAIRVNVDVKWMSGGELHARFMDTGVVPRPPMPFRNNGPVAADKKRGDKRKDGRLDKDVKRVRNYYLTDMRAANKLSGKFDAHVHTAEELELRLEPQA